MNSDPEVMRWLPSALTRKESDQLMTQIDDGFASRGFGVWAAERRDDGAFLGFVGLNVPRWELPFWACVEVAWRLSRAAWGFGYATEGAREALRFGFEDVGLERIRSWTVPENRRSLAVMDRLGMTRLGEFDHPALPDGHALRRHVHMVLERTDWQAAR